MRVPPVRAAAEPAVLLLGGRSHREFAALRALGVRIVYLDNQVPLDCIMSVDLPVDVPLDDLDLVRETVRHIFSVVPPAAVLTHVEPRLVLMTQLAEDFGLAGRGLGTEAALNCRDKWRTREVLTRAGVPCPVARLVTDTSQAQVVATELGLPVVVKPRGGAGGFGVRMCEDLDQVREAAAAVLAQNPGGFGGVVIEEYVAGEEYAVQTVTVNGRTRIASILRQATTPPPVFVELGYQSPSGLTEAESNELASIVSDALAALGITDWVAHTQVRRGMAGFRIIEVNARRPGGRLVEMTTALSGVDLVQVASRLSLGLDPEFGQPDAAASVYRSVVFQESGTLDYSLPELDPGAGTLPIVELDVLPGHPVHPVDHPEGGVYGRVVAFGDSLEAAAAEAERLHSGLGLRVDTSSAPLAEDSREFKSCC